MTNEEIDQLTNNNLKNLSLNDQCTFDDLPIEIFLNICNFLDLNFVNSTLSLVCKKFYNILSDESLWKAWLNKRVQCKKYPPMEDDLDSIDWRKECVYVDHFNTMWGKTEYSNHHHFVSHKGHTAVINAVLLKNDGAICVSGSHDRNLVLWDLKKIVKETMAYDSYGLHDIDHILGEEVLPYPLSATHTGWVWDLATPSSSSPFVLSASWDSYIKMWDITTSLTLVQNFKCATTVLGVTCIDENISVASLYTPHLVVLDKRAGSEPINNYRIHKRAVLDISVASPNSNLIYTCSEDGYLASFDLRAGAVLNKTLLGQSEESGIYALRLAVNHDIYKNIVFAGDSNGALHMVDAKELNVLSSTKLFPETTRKNKITGLSLDHGALLTCTSNGNVKFMNPSSPLNDVNEISEHRSFTAIHFQNDILVTADDTRILFTIPESSYLFP